MFYIPTSVLVGEPNFFYHLHVLVLLHSSGLHFPYSCYSVPYPLHTHDQGPLQVHRDKEVEHPYLGVLKNWMIQVLAGNAENMIVKTINS